MFRLGVVVVHLLSQVVYPLLYLKYQQYLLVRMYFYINIKENVDSYSKLFVFNYK